MSTVLGNPSDIADTMQDALRPRSADESNCFLESFKKILYVSLDGS